MTIPLLRRTAPLMVKVLEHSGHAFAAYDLHRKHSKRSVVALQLMT
ncbi:MAG TPA: hypothetical protein VEI25_21565 [Paraburkholderia sp.]|nr:hypothetical protein [Paraburkholderia sp.]